MREKGDSVMVINNGNNVYSKGNPSTANGGSRKLSM
jgi:hypothetical protein